MPSDHPKRGRRWHRQEVFKCSVLCRKQGTAEYDQEEQAARNCALGGFDTRTWTSENLVQIHMGAPPRFDLEGQRGDWMNPHEDIEAHGCPGAYYRGPFMRSLERYRRRRDANGNRVENPELVRCCVPIIREAIAYLEQEEEHCYAVQAEQRDAHADSED